MKSAVIYYSYSGNTRKVAEVLAEHLKSRGEVTVREIKALDESGNFFLQGRRAFKKMRARIEPLGLDLAAFDLVCLGTPVWAFGPTPAMNACLDQCAGLVGKDVFLFTTSGGGGDQRCLAYMEEVLAAKGAANFKKLALHQNKLKDRDFVLARISEIV